MDLHDIVMATLAGLAIQLAAAELRHGHARAIWVTLADAGAGALLTVCDNGAGFRRRGTGRGLSNIAARAAALGGRAAITTRAGLGTIVWVTVPPRSRRPEPATV